MKNSFNKERLEFIAENVNGILWEADAETFAFTYVSSQSNSILGYPPEAWYQSPSFWKEHIHPDDREQTVAFCHRKTEENEDHEFEYRMIDTDGNVVWLKDLVTIQQKEDGSKVLTGLMIDITDQRSQSIQEEEVLKKSYELADIGHWEVDLVEERLYWSQEVKKLHEVDQSYEPDLETAIKFYEAGEHREAIRNAVNDAIENGKPFDLELKMVTAQGNIRWVRAVGETEFKNGSRTKVYGSTQDITKRKSAELQLKETEEKYRSILENSTILFYRHDTDHNLTYVSPQAKDFLGVEPGDELEAWTDYLTDHPVNSEAIKKTNTAIQTGERQPPYEIQLQKQTGERIWAQVNEAPVVKEGNTVAMVGSLTDITKKKENKQKLERLSRVARETQNIVIITDPRERITWVNKAFEQITGYNLEEAKGKNPGELLQGSKTDSKTVRRVAKQISQQEPFSEQILNYSKDGTPYWVEMDIMPIKNQEGDIEEFFAIQEVITEQVRRKQQLEEQSERLKEAQHIANVGDWHYDIRSGNISWSEMIYEIFERNKELSPPSFEELINSYKTNKPQGLKKLVKRAIEQNEQYERDFEIRSDKGNTKYIKTRGIPITNENGEVTALRGIVQDITKRKKAELELQERQQQLSSVTNSINGLILRYLMDTDDTEEITYISDGVSQVYEISPEEVMKSPQKIWNLVLEEDLDEMQSSVKDSANKLSYWDHTWRIETPSGKLKWLHGRGNPTELEDGTVRWDTVIFDVTEQEKAKQERNELYDIIGESVNEIYIFDVETLRIKYVNNAATENIGYSINELRNMSLADLKPEYSTNQFKDLIGSLAEERDKEIYFQTVHQRKDGSYYPVDVYLWKDTYRGNEVLVASILDVSERTEATQKLRSLIETAPVPIYIESPEGEVRDLWNKAAEDIFGFSEKEITGQKLPHVDDPSLDDYHKMLSKIKKGLTIKGEEVTRKRKDGTYFPARVSASPLQNEQGEVEDILVVIEDITEQKQLEEDLKEQVSISESILDSLPGLFYMMDEDLNFVRLNNNVYDFFDLTQDEVEKFDPLNLIASSEQAKVKQKIEEVINTGYAETETIMISGDQEYNFFINGKLLELGKRKYIVGNGINITDRVKTQRKNRVLLQEIHHRVKNNLAIISGLLSMEMEEFKNDDARLSFQRSINRIHSMAKVHELLYNTEDFSSVNIAQYLKELSSIIQTTFDQTQTVDIEIDVERIDMNINEAIPLGMLMNELLTNSLKYAFENAGGNITLRITKNQDGYQVIYYDNGRGMASKPDLANADSLGFTIIHTLLQQLDADFELDVDNKFELTFTFGRKIKGSHSSL